jgi:hypothetical protein
MLIEVYKRWIQITQIKYLVKICNHISLYTVYLLLNITNVYVNRSIQTMDTNHSN